MSIPAPTTKVTNHLSKDEIFVRGRDIVQAMKDDLLYILTHSDSDQFASEYLQDRIEMWEENIKAWKDKRNGN